jgi:hypothetical protein
MKKIAFIIGLLFCLYSQAQILVNESTTVNGINLTSCYVHIQVNAYLTYETDSAGSIIDVDTVIKLYAHQFASIAAYIQGKNALQIDQLIDCYTYYNDLSNYFGHYKHALLDKNKTWKAENIIILK